MIKKFFFIFIFYLFWVSSSNGQFFSFSKEIKFVKYLQDNEQFDLANAVLNNIDSLYLNTSQKDSLFFEKGWFAYVQKRIDTAIYYLQKVSISDSRFLKSSFFAQYCNAYLKQYEESEIGFKKIPVQDSLEIELKSFELAGLALLQKNEHIYKDYQKYFRYKHYMLVNEELAFDKYNNERMALKFRSPVVAGILSAVIPGLGKVYAGKKKQGLGAFFPVLSSALLTWEAYNRGGLKDARFWIFGTIFTTFYIGNIWGSISAVSIKNQEINRSYENKILFNMHIPLRNFFN